MSKTLKQTSQSAFIRYFGAGVVDQCGLAPDVLEVVRVYSCGCPEWGRLPFVYKGQRDHRIVIPNALRKRL